MKRKFITNLGFFLLLNVIIKPIYVFGIDRTVQNEVGAEIYGRYFVFFNVALIFQILLDLGIETFIRNEISKYPKLLGRYLSNIAVLKILLLIPYFLICSGVAFARGLTKTEIPLLVIILINQFTASFILYFRSNLGGLQKFKTESIVSVLDRILMILIVGYLLINVSTRSVFRIEWFVLAQTFSYSVVVLISFLLLMRSSKTIKPEFNLKFIWPIINRLKPYAALVLLMAIYYRGDSVLLGILLHDGDEQAGIYAHGFRILDFMSNYALLFPILLLPLFSKTIQQGKKIDGLLKLSTFLLIVPSFIVLVPAVLYRIELFQLLYDEQISLSADAFAILTISFLGMCISYTFGALLTANGNLQQLIIMAACAVVLSITLNFILIPKYKVMGAAISNASTQIFTILVHILIARRIFKLSIKYATILRLILFSAVLLLSGLIVNRFNLDWYFGTIVIITTGVFLAFVTGLISIRGIFIILRREDLS
ncbi:MAG: polysaccharide biosynthesis C-terminal domain-containing protein [Bacteroidales bacterium]|nr:polysaccharide biosynthesis C-terminal domain-containing protein [Bacteroidales bacterium]